MRLIDANALQFEPKNGVLNGVLFMGRATGKTLSLVQSCLEAMINNAPTIDAVEVVRCKDCKHRGSVDCPMHYEEDCTYTDDDGYSEWYWIEHDHTCDDGFCDRGERRDSDG